MSRASETSVTITCIPIMGSQKEQGEREWWKNIFEEIMAERGNLESSKKKLTH